MQRVGTAVLFVALGSGVFANPDAYVMNSNMTVTQVNMTTNASSPYGPSPFPSDSLAVSPSGNLFTVDPFGIIWDITFGQVPVGPTLRTDIADLHFAGNGLWGFSNSSQEIFFFDLAGNTVNYAQTITIPGAVTMTGVAYQASTGDVFLSGYDSTQTSFLYVVPAWSNSANLIGTLGHTDSFSYVSDIEFASNGELYAMTWFHRHFLKVNPLDASTTTLSIGPHQDSTAMAIKAIPEPTTLGALALAAMLLSRRRSKRA